jgi:hypothetical protein
VMLRGLTVAQPYGPLPATFPAGAALTTLTGAPTFPLLFITLA